MIKTKNNWEYITFWDKDTELKSINKVEIAGKIYSARESTSSRDYYDMGKEYTSTFKDYIIEEVIFGQLFPFKLSTLIEDKVKVKFIQ